MDFSILNILVRTRALPALRSVVRGRSARLLHVRPGDGRFPDAPDRPLDALHVQSRLRPARRHDPAGRVHARAQLGRTLRAGIAGAALTLLLGNLAGLREWLVQQAPARLGLLLGDLAGHPGHDQRVPVLEPGLRRPARARSGDPALPLRRGLRAPVRAAPLGDLPRGSPGGCACREPLLGFRRRAPGPDQRLGRAAAGGRFSSLVLAGRGARMPDGLSRAAARPRGAAGRGAAAVAACARLRPAPVGPRRRAARPRQEPRGRQRPASTR